MTTIIGFETLAAQMQKRGEYYAAQIPPQWRQGRTAYGGLTAGLALRAAHNAFADLAPLRSSAVSFIGPVGEHSTFTPRILRRGKNVTPLSVDVMSQNKDAEMCLSGRVALVFGASRDSALSVAQSAAPAPAPDDCPLFTPEQFEAFVPKFFLQFDTRLISGHRPMSGAQEGYIECWTRHKDESSRSGTAALLTLGDVLPPAALPMFKTMGPVSSVTWLFNLLTDAPQTKEGWWRVDTRLTAAQSGYSSQIMRVWNTDGALVAEGMQSVAVFV